MDCLSTAVATAGLILISAPQLASAQSASPGNLGLRAPNPQTAIERNAIRPDLAPMTPYVTQMPLQVPGLAPGHVPTATGLAPNGNQGLTVPVRSLAEPVVAANSVGFYNDAGQPLGFQFVVGGVSQKIELAPRQILTVQADAAGSELKAIIGTGNTDFQTVLARGKLYILRADGAKWVLAAF